MQNPKVQPLSEPWAVEARARVAAARATSKEAAEANEKIRLALGDAEARLAELDRLIPSEQARPAVTSRVGTLDQVEAALLAADAQSRRVADLEREAEALRRKVPLLENLLRNASNASASAKMGISVAEGEAWKALADALKPAMLEAAAVVRTWRLAMREGSQYPNDWASVATEFLEGDSAENRRAVEILRQQLALPEEV